MDVQNEKCVLILDGSLPPGVIANTAAIMGITLGKRMPETVGPDVADQTDTNTRGSSNFPYPF